MASDFGTSDGAGKVGRRAFLLSAASALGGLAFWSWKTSAVAEAHPAPATPGTVTIVQFSDAGRRLGKARLAKVTKTEQQWRQQLSPAAFEITRQQGTELAYTGQYWNLHEAGLYRCVGCGNALFSSQTKFDSGTGWPSFWAPIAQENVSTANDSTLGIDRTEVHCTLCDGHLGHVFDDGPEPTHLRYCMNSVALRFVARQR